MSQDKQQVEHKCVQCACNVFWHQGQLLDRSTFRPEICPATNELPHALRATASPIADGGAGASPVTEKAVDLPSEVVALQKYAKAIDDADRENRPQDDSSLGAYRAAANTGCILRLIESVRAAIGRAEKAEAERDGIRDVLRESAWNHGALHEEDCPQDDTWDCKWLTFNERVNKACGMIEPQSLTFMSRANVAEAELAALQHSTKPDDDKCFRCGAESAGHTTGHWYCFEHLMETVHQSSTTPSRDALRYRFISESKVFQNFMGAESSAAFDEQIDAAISAPAPENAKEGK